MERHDAIVIGAGLDGLTAAATLARAGLRVLVLDRNAAPGGLAASLEIAPGFHVPRYVLGAGGLSARLVADLGLAQNGLRFVRAEGGVTLFSDGHYHASYRDGDVHRRELSRFSRRDADAWTRYRRDMLRAARALTPLLESAAALPVKRGFAGLKTRLGFAGGEVLDAPPRFDPLGLSMLQATEFLDTYFESAPVKVHLAAAAMMGGTLGPCSPGSAMRLLTPWLATTGDAYGGAPDILLPYGGPSALTAALVAVIEAHGGTLRLDAEVTDISMKDRKVRGVVLANGEEIAADSILSGLDLKRSFLSLFQWKDLPDGLVERVGRFRMKGAIAKVNLALDDMPAFPGLPEGCPSVAGGLRFAGTIGTMQRAFDDWRAQMPPRDPLIEVLIPSLSDATLAPPGCHVLSALVQYVPETLHEGAWNAARRGALGDLVVARLGQASPGIADRIVAREVLLAADLEDEIGLTAGDIAYGETTLDQMFFNRPLSGTGGYGTPLRNFYLCSPSTHPGPLMPGQAGANAAAHVLALRRKRS